ncbi:hypothetical protein DFH94DRAFT_378858 [Russula ochroleuca]|jgi:hypothetical protein|uniref:Tetratricopeptide repeat protein n=1 Tax=Russula ochroleuca TaxID=152965 RepID=A0A9P5MZT3_9AGAM|nr:hypothetical protein DFH94DRAFT_378858 [Russula ochroleuca]
MCPWVRAHTTSANTNSEVRSALGRGYLQAGQLNQAEAHFAAISADTNAPETTQALNAAFLASARGDWEAAGTLLRELVGQDDANYAVHHRHRRRAAAVAWVATAWAERCGPQRHGSGDERSGSERSSSERSSNERSSSECSGSERSGSECGGGECSGG